MFFNFFPTSERAGGMYREYRGSRCLVRFTLQRWGRSNQQLYLSGEFGASIADRNPTPCSVLTYSWTDF